MNETLFWALWLAPCVPLVALLVATIIGPAEPFVMQLDERHVHRPGDTLLFWFCVIVSPVLFL